MSIYREYDIRGIFEKDLNQESVMCIGYALSEQIPGRNVVVGYDARVHSSTIFRWLAEGLNRGGKRVLDMGLVPTPVNYFANYLEFDIDGEAVSPDASVMITGSHNPPEYNGFKITIERMPFFGEQIYALGRRIDEMEVPEKWETDIVSVEVKKRYIDYMTEHFAHLEGLQTSFVYDCGNGAAGTVLPEIFSRLKLKAKGIYVKPDGRFPNHHPDPSVEENLADVKKELANGYDLAFAFDGDADRIAVVTPKHNIKGDQMALLFALLMENPVVVGEVKCSQVMYDTLEERGANPVMYKTGHSNLKVKIKELDADLACEVSGHIFFNDRYYGFDDAIYAALRILELIHAGIDPDAELEKLPRVYSTEEIKIETSEEEKFLLVEKLSELLQNPPEEFPAIRKIIDIDGVRVVFERGWGLIRPSNTTPVLVARFESDDYDEMKRYEEAMNTLLDRAKSFISQH